MECWAPPLDLCVSLRLGLESGQSVMHVIKTLRTRAQNEMLRDLAIILTAFERGEPAQLPASTNDRIYRKALLELIEAGLKGEPILNPLKELETEILKSCHADIEKFVGGLPLRAMLPLMLIQFPAFLILLLGPIVSELLKGLNG